MVAIIDNVGGVFSFYKGDVEGFYYNVEIPSAYMPAGGKDLRIVKSEAGYRLEDGTPVELVVLGDLLCGVSSEDERRISALKELLFSNFPPETVEELSLLLRGESQVFSVKEYTSVFRKETKAEEAMKKARAPYKAWAKYGILKY